MEREVAPGWRFGFWWIWILVIVAIWYVGFGWGGHGGYFRHSSGAVAQNDAAPTGDGVQILDATDKARYAGQVFQARNVPVEQAAGHQGFWIGAVHNSIPMLLVLPTAPNDAAANAEIRAGGWVNVNGQVIAAPNAAQAKQQWGLSDADVRRLEQEGAYIQGTQVVAAPH